MRKLILGLAIAAIPLAWLENSCAAEPPVVAETKDSFADFDKNPAGAPEIGSVWSLVSLIGKQVPRSDEGNLGSVQDIVVDLDRAEIVLLLVGEEENAPRIPIPWEALAIADEDALGQPAALRLAAEQRVIRAAESIPRNVKISHDQLHSIRAHYGLPAEDDEGELAESWGAKGRFGRLFNAKNVRSIVGKVLAVADAPPQSGMSRGTQIKVLTDDGEVQVHVGPVGPLRRQQARFRRGDKVEIAGSEGTVAGKPALLASRVRRGGRVWRLRDAAGAPLWANEPKKPAHELQTWSELAQEEVRGEDKSALASISDLAIVPATGAIAYTALRASDGTDEMYPVPLSALIVRPGETSFLLELPAESLRSTVTFSPPDWPQVIDRGWVEYAFVRYGRSPFDGVGEATRAEKLERR